jgi:anaerobic ribonucleoside-triphosphate reductase activating protein
MSDARQLRVHAWVPHSRANGPGVRAVLWVQGCTLACAGCFNPATHARGGRPVATDALAERILALGDSIEGVTLSGGEPLQQRPAVADLLRRLRAATTLSTLVFTGYRWSEVTRMAEFPALRRDLDVLIAGRYEQDRPRGRGLLGSGNQTVHLLSDRYRRADLDGVPAAEVLVGPDGAVTVTGVDPPALS